ncbi:helix-turn-helix domain-containing protein [Vibrio fluvialis]|nr:hypothetical protein [Vibrio fluvialis]
MSIPNAYWDLVDNIGGMKGAEKALLVFLCRKANSKENYSSWYSVSEMARMLCISERSVKNATKVLSDMGLITKQRTWDSSSIYTLNLERISQLGRDNICLYQNEEEAAKPTENPQQEIGKGSICLRVGQYLPEGGAVFAYKNVIEDVIENVNTGETSGVHDKVTHCNDFSLDLNLFWKAIRTHVRDVYQVERFPSRPSQEDVDAMEWAIGEMLPNGVNDDDCRLLCFFVDNELGEPQSVLNPIVRLRLAYDAHEWPEMRFSEPCWQYIEDHQLS